MPELTVAQAYALDARFGWLWYLGATRRVRTALGVRFIGEPWKRSEHADVSQDGLRADDPDAQQGPAGAVVYRPEFGGAHRRG
jgi:hypothetical protein